MAREGQCGAGTIVGIGEWTRGIDCELAAGHAGVHRGADPQDPDPVEFEDEDKDEAKEAFFAEMANECRASYVTGGHDPSGTACDLPRGHAGPHSGDDPFGGGTRISWSGGGSAGGDALPYRNVTWGHA